MAVKLRRDQSTPLAWTDIDNNFESLQNAVDQAVLSSELAQTTGAAGIGADDGASGSLWISVQGFINKILSSAGSAVVGFVQAGTGAVARTVQSKNREVVSVKDFGAVGDGVADDTAAFTHAMASGAKQIHVPAGTYYFAAAPIWDSLSGVTFKGDSPETSLFKWNDGAFAMKSMSFCTFKDIGFSPAASDSLYPVVKVSNYADVVFDNCIFRGFGGATTNKAGSVCIYMLCSDAASSDTAAGSSEGAMFLNCRFYGSSRKTNFAIRVHNNNFTATTATNTGAKIIGCTFGGFNWNAVEIAGTTVSGCIIDGCVANACGLQPFDIDKGAHSNTISNCTINRLLGNIDLVANPGTRTSVATIQGFDPSGGYAYNNTIRNIVAYLKKADLDAYGNGCAVAGVAYGQNNVIDGVTVYCDGVPARGAGKRYGMACVSFETAAGNQVRNVLVNNASAGIVQTNPQNAAMTSTEPNVFENIKNIGTMTEEAIQVAAGAAGGAFSRNIIRNVELKTDLSNPYYSSYTYTYAILAVASGSSSHFLKIKDSVIDLAASASKWFVLDQIARLGLEDVVLYDNGTSAATRFIHSESSTVPSYLAITGLTQNFGQDPLDLATSMQYLNQTTLIGARLANTGIPQYGATTLFASASPTYPAAGNWNTHLRVERISKAANSYLGWTSIGGVWKTYGTVSA